MWHINCPLSAPILDYPARKAGFRKTICSQHQKNETEAIKTEKSNSKAKKLRENLSEEWKNMEDIFHY